MLARISLAVALLCALAITYDIFGRAGRPLRHAGHDVPVVPYALAAKFAHPDTPVIASIGDGAMQMLGISPRSAVFDARRSAWRLN